jgi:hypothetical protein
MFNLVNHTEDDGRIVVLNRLVYFVQTECIQVSALSFGLANTTPYLSDFQSCHVFYLD